MNPQPRPAALALPLEVPFDQYQRYRLVAELGEILSSGAGGTGLRVLDVGGHYQDLVGQPRRPIAEFLPRAATTTIDLPAVRLRGYARARGSALPFAEGTFDLVSCLDVLEHVPRTERAQVIAEAKRVSARSVVFAAPFDDPLIERAERLVAEFVERTWGEVQQQLREHRQHGLPDLEAVRQHLTADGWTVQVVAYGNLWRWVFMMIDKLAAGALPGGLELHRAVDAHYNREVFERDREPPCYRHFLIATRDPAGPLHDFVRQRFGSGRVTASQQAEPDAAVVRGFSPAPAVQPGFSPATAVQPGFSPADTAELLFDVAALHADNQALQIKSEPHRRDAHVREAEAHRADMYRHLAAKDAYIAKLENLLRQVERSYPHRIRQWIKKAFAGGG